MCTVSMETVAALRAALQGVQDGTVNGAAIVEFHEGGYTFTVTGSARENPALTVSTLLVAQVDLARSLNLTASLVLESMPLVLRQSGRGRKAPDTA